MKILTLRRLFWLSAIGGFAYVHKQRGGQWTMNSISDTFRHLWSSVTSKAAMSGSSAREPLQRMPGSGAAMDNGLSNESSPKSYGRYGKRDDDTGRH